MPRFFVCFFVLFLLSFSAYTQHPLQLSSNFGAGYYDAPIEVALYANQPEAQIHYTLDGSTPTLKSSQYTAPIRIDSTQALRARAFYKKQKGPTASFTFLLEERTALPVFSIFIEPDIVFDSTRGIFQLGPYARQEFPYEGANFWSDKEFPVHIQFFEQNRQLILNHGAGFRLFGGMSRAVAQKSMALVARNHYGNKHFEHRFFADKPIKKFRHLVLRNAGSDAERAHLRDVFFTSIGKEMGLTVQAARSCIVFINGHYWGIYHLREKINKHFIEDNFKVDDDSLDLLEHRYSVKAGSARAYQAFLRFLNTHDLSIPQYFDELQQKMTVWEYLDYQILQIYLDNWDAGGNIKFWRAHRPDARWHWILYDTDFGMGMKGPGHFAHKSLAFHTKADGPKWPNPPWSTLILRKLLENPNAKAYFIQRFLDHLHFTFKPQKLQQKLETLIASLKTEFPRHWKRWNFSPKIWSMHIERMKKFIQKRPHVLRQEVHDFFELPPDSRVQLKTRGSGQIVVNSLGKVRQTQTLFYPEGTSLHLRVAADVDWRFSHWVGLPGGTNQEALDCILEDSSYHIEAVFVREPHPLTQRVQFSELLCRDSLVSDWIELYNPSQEALSLEHWQIHDLTHQYTLPKISIPAQGYLILATDTATLTAHYPTLSAPCISIPFKLSSKQERLLLYDPFNRLIDSFSYRIRPYQRTQTLSLALIHPDSNNSLMTHWTLSPTRGTPAQKNISPPQIVKKINKNKLTDNFTYISILLLLLLLLILFIRYHRIKS